MMKSIRTAALTSVLALTVSPMLVAEPMGTDPRPKATQPIFSGSILAYTVLAFFGI
ncbi:MAG: hypothetical protein NVSMB3_03330 [Acidobacteriaceae bacterium]